MTTLEKVQAQIAKLQARADELVTNQSSTVIAKIRDMMEVHGLTIADIDAYVGSKKRGRVTQVKPSSSGVVSAKYRDPKTGATWSGRGRAPVWIASAKNRDRFLVDGGVQASKAVAAAPAKRAGNYPRGPQPAKYRDPKSGATWSGRGRAPAWLAGVKNLDAFLISTLSDSTAAASTPAKKVSAKKVGKPATAKKSAAKKSSVAKTSAKKEGAVAVKTATKKAAAKKVAGKRAIGTKKVATKKVATKRVAVKKAPEQTDLFAPASEAATGATEAAA
ncbi:DNA-binding protein H-NS [Paraburkholderia steynii]|uniref:DNA-binding protein H-NS n=1 Tax=Paraburkholderia steynii TaxID=1245441 RepID=A0A7Z7BJ35_9BURK|nr:H-NS family nucleoid-associated regulatory protein [Paraburkholderia steynii]SDJ36225.1 DNA-binding protein H-NS [Paraburkholderia steynii]